MATSSIFTELTLTDERSITRMVEALESSEKAAAEETQKSEPIHWLIGDEVRTIFGSHGGDNNGVETIVW